MIMKYDKEKVELYLTNGAQTVIDHCVPGTALWIACIANDIDTAFEISDGVWNLIRASGTEAPINVESLTYPVPLSELRGSTRLLVLVATDALRHMLIEDDEQYRGLHNSLATTAYSLEVTPLDLIIEVSEEQN